MLSHKSTITGAMFFLQGKRNKKGGQENRTKQVFFSFIFGLAESFLPMLHK